MTANLLADDGWVPTACTLPSIERPLRLQEFDDLFAEDLVGVVRDSPTQTSLDLRGGPEVAARAAALAAKEIGCCSFFTFNLSIGDGTLCLAVSTSPTHGDVLAALSDRAESHAGGTR